jgi:hypothetical protein
MPPKKQTDISLPEVIDLVAEPIMKQKRVKKVKEVLDAVVEIPVVEVVQDKPKKARKVKTPVAEVMPELELNRNYDEPVKEVKPKVGNAWIAHIRAFAEQNGLTYNKAMLDPRLKETYVKSTKGKVSF